MKTRKTRKTLRLVASAAALAAVLYALAAAPGLVSDRDSTVPARTREAAR